MSKLVGYFRDKLIIEAPSMKNVEKREAVEQFNGFDQIRFLAWPHYNSLIEDNIDSKTVAVWKLKSLKTK